MKDVFQKVLDWLGHNRGLVCAALIGVSVLVTGCMWESKTTSPTTGQQVTALELGADFDAWYANWQAEGESMTAQFQAAGDIIERKNEQIMSVVGFLDGLIQMTPIAPFLGAAGLTGLAGLFWDNTRKDKKITAEKAKVAALGGAAG